MEIWKNGFFHKGGYTYEANACACALALAIDTCANTDVYTEEGEFIASYSVIVCEDNAEAEYLVKRNRRHVIAPCRIWNEGNVVITEGR